MEYNFKYKKDGSLFWKTKRVIGHATEVDKNGKCTGSIILYYSNGSLEVIPNWSNYHFRLGTDWLIASKKQAEEESNTELKLKKGIGES